MFKLSFHAKNRIQDRPVVSEAEVLGKLASVENRIARSTTDEVKVVVKTLKGKVSFPDGSNGDTVLACVDPRNGVVKTVMLQRGTQVARKAAESNDYIW